jgi:primosomal protein N' (replication factor Y)
VLDDEALLTPDLLRLTRWMADYYLCGWGQVLNAVVPAGAKDRAGTRTLTFIEALPEAEWPQPAPTLTAKQQAALDQLRAAGKPLELRQLAKRARCGPGPVEALLLKGVARRLVRRVDRFAEEVEAAAVPEAPITLNAAQLQAWAPIEQALRDGGFHAFLLYGVTGGRPAQPPGQCGTRRPLAAGGGRAGSGRGRGAQCRLCPDAAARSDRHRRGARGHLQARIDAALPCP